MWMAHSSLNWELNTTRWHLGLLDQCNRDCDGWRQGMIGTSAEDGHVRVHNCKEKYCGYLAGDFKERTHPFARRNIEDLFECKAGCEFFSQCKKEQPKGTKPPLDTAESLHEANAEGYRELNAQRGP
eukprot:g1314.t1